MGGACTRARAAGHQEQPKATDTHPQHAPAPIPQNGRRKERAIFTELAAATGKAPNLIEKMVQGRMSKWHVRAPPPPPSPLGAHLQ